MYNLVLNKNIMYIIFNVIILSIMIFNNIKKHAVNTGCKWQCLFIGLFVVLGSKELFKIKL